MKWKMLQHNGILFPPAFKSKGIEIKIKGDSISLNLEQEEMVYQWAKKKDTLYVQDKIFQKNFTSDFAKMLNSKFKNLQYSDIDFSQAYKLVDKETDLKVMMSKEEKKMVATKRKRLREKLKEEYGKAIIDGKEVEVGNYMAEPPGIFIGRGDHPLRGKWKSRVTSKDVILNLGKGAKIPKGDWKDIVHDQDSMWLASWMDELSQKRKYVWLSDSAGIKQERDKAKYDKAKNLAQSIEKIKNRMVKDMNSKDKKLKKIATACYLIYITAMRVGDEKDPEEADTVGATTLRKEHIELTGKEIKFDFLGKDSVRWQETIPAVEHDKTFHNNLRELVSNKTPSEDIFDKITSRHVNEYYSGIVKGLTAKVFRTYLASSVVSNYLINNKISKNSSSAEKLHHLKLANLEAAKMCNHKRTIPKKFEEKLQKKHDTLKKIENTKPAEKAEKILKKVMTSIPKTDKQKQAKEKRIKTLNQTIKKQKQKHRERVEKLKLQVDLVTKTRDYNLGTSLRNYIDPRIFKAWTNEAEVEWEKLYTFTLQKKFLWVKAENKSWKSISQHY